MKSIKTIVAALAFLAPVAAHAGTATCLNASDNPFTAAAAAKGPSISVCANGLLFSFVNFTANGKLQTMPSSTFSIGNGMSFTMSAIFNSDPFVTFTFGSIVPSGFGPVVFDAIFSTPVVGGAYNNAASTGTLGVTANGTTATTASVSQGSIANYITGTADATNLNVGTGSGVCSVTTPPSPKSTSCNPPGATSNFAPISPSTLTAHLNYTQNTTGSIDGVGSVAWSGGISLNATTTTTPEPSTVALMLVGLVAVGAGYRRKKST